MAMEAKVSRGPSLLLVLGVVASSLVVGLIACTGGSGSIDPDASASSSSSGSSSSSTSSSGASSSSSGFITDGGPGGCLGAVTFELTSDSTNTCAGSSCSNTFVSVLAADRTALTTANDCQPQCGVCEQTGCPANCPQPNLVPAGGLRSQWSGKLFDSLQCQSPSEGRAIACLEPRCAPAGKYVAKFCAFRGGDAGLSVCSEYSSSVPQTCTEVEFTYPTTAPVTAKLL